MKQLLLLTFTVFLIPFLCCTPATDPAKEELEQLEQQVHTEAGQFEALLTDMVTLESELLYPNDIPISSIIPQRWLFEIQESENAGDVQECVLCIPVPQNTKTGLTVMKSDEGWIYYARAGYLNPKTDIYVVSSMPKKGRYEIWEGPTDFNKYPEKIVTDVLPSHTIVLSPYYIPETVTHGLYIIDGPNSYRDGGTNYDLNRIIDEMYDANPYLEETTVEGSLNTVLLELHEELLIQIKTTKDDINNVLSFIDTLESAYFKPNAWSWNTQDEITGFRDSMDITLAGLSQIETSSQEICNWNFSNLEKYRAMANTIP